MNQLSRSTDGGLQSALLQLRLVGWCVQRNLHVTAKALVASVFAS